ncbi:hypothetical protein [Rhodoferax antarcticus]|uniref:hypothetical protein n=1 Tax=Rhodoferax antarcticus TaxID=81479 RepID=UPI00222473AE|nr:hypothetical protein [Rhodoferax antarcticus]MCW2311836.1 fructose-specific phosphotransferase system IIC component [Rhodoferax antarcticus]
MQTDSYLIPALFMFTFIAAIAAAIYQYFKAKKAKTKHIQSAQAKALGERPGERHGGIFSAHAAKVEEEKTKHP